MANTCPTQVDICRLRVARLEQDGTPDAGANNLYVTDKAIRIAYDPQYVEPQPIQQDSGCGDTIVDIQPPPKLSRVNFDVLLGTQDPELSELMAGGAVLTDGAAVGWGLPRIGEQINPFGVSLEFWVAQYDISGDLDPDFPYARYVAPRVKLRPGSKTFEHAPQNHAFSGYAIENPNWFNGPLNDWDVASDRTVQWLPWDEALPDAECGYQSLVAS